MNGSSKDDEEYERPTKKKRQVFESLPRLCNQIII